MQIFSEILTNPLFNRAKLAQRIGTSPTTLNRIAIGGSLPPSHFWGLCRELAKANIMLAGWAIDYDKEVGTLTFIKQVGPVKTTEHALSTGTWVEYKISQERVSFTQKQDLSTFLRSINQIHTS